MGVYGFSGYLNVLLHLSDESLHTIERKDRSQVFDEVDPNLVSVDVLIEVEEMKLDGGRRALERWPRAQVEGTRVGSAPQNPLNRVDPRRGHELVALRHRQVGRGESELVASALATYNHASHRIWSAQTHLGLPHATGRDGFADT